MPVLSEESGRALTPTSYLVLGLVRHLEPCTSYDMKRMVKVSIGNFWSFPHSQLYAEPARLAEEGYLTEDQEEEGRRRRIYRLTAKGSGVLHDWVRIPAEEIGELRDEGLLKLFFSDTCDRNAVADLARAQAKVHEDRIEWLAHVRERLGAEATDAQLATLELGLRWDRTAADFWAEVADTPPV